MYVLANIAFYTTLTPAEVLGSEAVAAVSHGDGDGDGGGDGDGLLARKMFLINFYHQTFGGRLYGYMAFIIPVSVAMSCFGGVNGILLTSSRWRSCSASWLHLSWVFLGFNRVLFLRLFYAGAVQGQMPEILSMIQVCVSAQLYHLFQFVRFHSPTLLIHILGGQVDSCSRRSHCGEIVVFYIFPQLFWSWQKSLSQCEIHMTPIPTPAFSVITFTFYVLF